MFKVFLIIHSEKLVAFISLMLIVPMLFSLSSCSEVEMAEGEIVAMFRYGDADISKQLTDEDAESVREIFNGKLLASDSPSCVFSEDVSIITNDYTYCIACDTCGIIYVIEEDKYFHLTDKENDTLRDLLSKYGFVFPCI